MEMYPLGFRRRLFRALAAVLEPFGDKEFLSDTPTIAKSKPDLQCHPEHCFLIMHFIPNAAAML
jgi:hypothetical protein